MKYFVILLILVGFSGSVFAQNLEDTQDDIWLPGCPKESKAECDKSSLFPDAISKPFVQSDLVAIGTIVQKENQEQNSIQYSINVDSYLKNYQPFDLLTATLNNTTDPKSSLDLHYYNSPVFNEGDLVFVYLEKSDGNYNLLPQSFALDKHEARGPPPIILLTHTPNEDNFEQGDEILVSGEVRKMELVKGVKDGKKIDVKLTIHDDNKEIIFSKLVDIGIDGKYSYILDTSKIPPGEYELEINYGSMTYSPEITINFNSKYWTPLKQFNSGIPAKEIQCKDNLVLIQKHDGSPSCVMPETRQKLIERGWAEPTKTKIKNSLLPPCTSDRTACFDQDTNICDPSGWKCENREVFSKIIPLPEFNSYSTIFTYIWNDFLLRQGITFEPKEQSYTNTDEGWYSGLNRVCSPIITSNGTEFYISSVFVDEPFEIIGTFIDSAKPDDCHKIWKTEAVLPEPDRELAMWLENYHHDD